MSRIDCVVLNIRHVFTAVADGCCKDGYEVPVQWPFMVAICMFSFSQWEFRDPKMKVLYHIRSYFGGIWPYISLTSGRYLQSTASSCGFILYIHHGTSGRSSICGRDCEPETLIYMFNVCIYLYIRDCYFVYLVYYIF